MLKVLKDFFALLWKDDRAFLGAILSGLKFAAPFLLDLFKGKGGQTATGIASALLGGVSSGISGRAGANTSAIDLTDTTTPTTLSEANPLRDALLGAFTQSVADPVNLPVDTSILDKIKLNQIANINATSRGSSNAIAASLAERGLSSSPGAVGSALGTVEAERLRNVSDLERDISLQKLDLQLQLPLIAEEIRQGRLGQAGSFFSSLPIGSTSTRKGTTIGEHPGFWGGFGSDIASTLAGLLSKNRASQQLAG